MASARRGAAAVVAVGAYVLVTRKRAIVTRLQRWIADASSGGGWTNLGCGDGGGDYAAACAALCRLVARDVPPRSRVLSVGCGRGAELACLAEAASCVTGVCAALGVPPTRATVDCSFADFGKAAHLRYSASRVANFLELRGRWAPARRLDAALRDARDGDGARSWGAWKADRGLDAASNACVRALDGQLSWVLSCSKRTLERFPAGPILAYARGLGLGLAGCLLARGSRDVVRVRPSVAALEAALAHGSELALGADVRNVGPDRSVGGRGPFDAVVLAVPPGALAAALDVDAVLPSEDRNLFAGFASETNRIALHCVLHADARLMPADRRDWRALNVTGGDGDGGAAMLTVWLNRYYPEHASRCLFKTSVFANMSAMAIKSHPGLKTLEEVDTEMYELIEQEKRRQFTSIELIASENFASRAIMDCLGSRVARRLGRGLRARRATRRCLTNKYAEGLPGKRYYGGNEIIDQIENMCKARALEAYRLKTDEWGVNVQPYSGSPANFAVYTGLLQPHDRIMGLDLPSGGHLTHGFYTLDKKTMSRKPVSATSVYFESLPYKVHQTTGLVDFDELAKMAAIFKPALIVCGGSAYPRDWDYAKFREIADANGSLLMMDMAHISGLVATQEANDPFKYCDIGGPHEHQIAGVAVQLKETTKPEFKGYVQQVKKNIKAMAAKLVDQYGYALATGGTDNHLLLWDLRPAGITGSKVEKICDVVQITLNKNAVPGDVSALSPGGVRIGAPAMTTRGLVEKDFEAVADLLHEAVQLALKIQAAAPSKKLVDFSKALVGNAEVDALREKVKGFASSFGMPGRPFGKYNPEP
ncbi:glycine hydroxymethyltransferase [Aureococcus anophagefferens]|nr:glycine hydroxymethyltransferase [Aureococcus anophagefferens]